MKKLLIAAPLLVVLAACGSKEPPAPVVKEMTPSPTGVTYEFANTTLEDVTTKAMAHCQSHGKTAQLINTSKSGDMDVAAFNCN